jgi:anti-sigma factor RsiW
MWENPMFTTVLHPTSRNLIAYLDDEIPVATRDKIAAHLCECYACRAELDLIEVDLNCFMVLDAESHPEVTAPADGLSRLLAATREVRRSHSELMEQKVIRIPRGF